MEFVIGVLALFFVLSVVLGVFVAVRTVRAVQRGVERTGTQVRRTVEETALRARSAQPGPVGELARQRLELRSSIDGTRRALESDVTRDPSLQEALGLLNRLHEHARQLDGEMRLLMDREPDKARARSLLPELRERVATIKESADSLRFAAQDRASRLDAEGLAPLREQIEIESGALRHWHGERPGSVGGAASVQGAGHGVEGHEIEGRETDRAPDGGRMGTMGDSAPGSATDRSEVPRGVPGFEKGRPRSAS
ncbi:hypothetical protein [Streptomyces marispadix]|uniref:Secreted protein n=1 Tax=Streptomyces marispadix TaxID=2922868 RepID=A0ABS9SVD8_9ACTN|nr:hypothetical protein [Streptomyces marispadix]MCH6160242.1 hypothetical protein [Streptomyces marispadix]